MILAIVQNTIENLALVLELSTGGECPLVRVPGIDPPWKGLYEAGFSVNFVGGLPLCSLPDCTSPILGGSDICAVCSVDALENGSGLGSGTDPDEIA
jgi:hypothetical protein